MQYSEISKISLLDDFTKEQYTQLLSISKEYTIPKGTIFINEGEYGENIFIILSGSVEILKKNTGIGKRDVKLKIVEQYDSIGGMSFLESSTRSTSVRTQVDTTVLEINSEVLKKSNDILNQQIHLSLLRNLAKLYSNRLRNSNLETAKLLINKDSIGKLIIITFSLSGIYTLSLQKIFYFEKFFESSTTISVIIMLIITFVSFLFTRKSHFLLEVFGLTLKDWKKDIKMAIIYSIPLMFFIFFLKIYLVKINIQPHIFDIKSSFNGDHNFTYIRLFFTIIIYSLFCPLQEFVARGVLQRSFSMFSDHELQKTNWTAIIVSNIAFSSFHAHTTIHLAIISFIAGLFWGWMFCRQKTLIGISVSHILLGVWTIFILGFRPF